MRRGPLAPVAAALLGVGLSVGGCAMPAWTSPPGPERYQVGYHDGCEAGLAIAGSFFYERIESARPAYEDTDYVTGWKEGYTNCKKKQDRIQATWHSILGEGD